MSKKCYYCYGNHLCRNCPIEKDESNIMKKNMGRFIETFVAYNINCLYCNNKLLVLGTHKPSLDLVCTFCNQLYEVKSKCLSIENLPSDIILKHGSYSKFLHRLNKGLNLIVIIYGVDRKSKTFNIKEILYAPNCIFKNKDIVNITKNKDNNFSNIFIKDKNLLFNIDFDKKLFMNLHFNQYDTNYIT